MRVAIERASALGCCVLGLSNTHHLGRIGQWAEQCADAGFASVHFVNALSTPLVAPWGGSDARLSTDPFCVGVPREPDPLILDYATSKVALGKVRVAQDKGARMAPDVLLDAAGRSTDDPAAMFARSGRRPAALRRAQGLRARGHVRGTRRRVVGRQRAAPCVRK